MFGLFWLGSLNSYGVFDRIIRLSLSCCQYFNTLCVLLYLLSLNILGKHSCDACFVTSRMDFGPFFSRPEVISKKKSRIILLFVLPLLLKVVVCECDSYLLFSLCLFLDLMKLWIYSAIEKPDFVFIFIYFRTPQKVKIINKLIIKLLLN